MTLSDLAKYSMTQSARGLTATAELRVDVDRSMTSALTILTILFINQYCSSDEYVLDG